MTHATTALTRAGEHTFEEVGRVLIARGLRLSKGTIVDATIIAAPNWTKNAEPNAILICTKTGMEINGTSA